MNFNQLWEFSTKGKNGSISSNIGPQVRRLLFTSTLHGSQRSYFPFERLFLPLICIDSSFQPSVQTNWRISGFASAKVCLFCWIFCRIQPNWSFEGKKECLHLLCYEPQIFFEHMFRTRGLFRFGWFFEFWLLLVLIIAPQMFSQEGSN